MNDVGYMDFAGSGVVHMAGGVAALVGAIISGPRAGRFEAGRADEFDPHSLPLIVLGTMILWFGWYGFNCGSTLEMHDASTGMMAAQVAMNTTIAAATGGLTVFIIRLNRLHKYDIGGFCNGILAGLVSITAGCGNVTCISAFVIAVLGGMLYDGASNLMKTLKIDDPIDAFAVHGACGAWGTLMCAMLDWGLNTNTYHGWDGFTCKKAADGSCLEKNVRGQGIAANIVEVLAIAIWVAAWSTVIFLPLRLSGMLRATDGVQLQGMDQAKHSPSKAYVMTG
jgi:Amt family ammonium transporter